METLIGHNNYRYKVNKDWGNLDALFCPVTDCHEMVMDSKGRLYLLTNNTKNNIIVYDKAGQLIQTWGNSYPGGHGLTISNENGEEFLYIADHARHQIIKTTLQGKEVMILPYPSETGVYAKEEAYLPTETAIAPNGNIYVADGYGLQYVIQYNHSGQYIRHWGGKGNCEDKFDCVHGIAYDNRDRNNPVLLITSRNHNAIKRFTLDGHYLSSIQLPGSFVCRPVVREKNIYAAVFRSESNQNFGSGYITILNERNEVISTPGGTEPMYENGKLLPQKQADKIFIHPHDVCVDAEENIYVPQWNSNKTYPIKLQRVLN
jgi:DNA-binding beta-propeller fold protein YncE